MLNYIYSRISYFNYSAINCYFSEGETECLGTAMTLQAGEGTLARYNLTLTVYTCRLYLGFCTYTEDNIILEIRSV